MPEVLPALRRARQQTARGGLGLLLLLALVAGACATTRTSPTAQPRTAAAVAPPPGGATDPLAAPLPLDPAVHMGRLDNGLTYFLRANHKPEDRAELWLVVGVGSIEEDEDQRGLAHFVEHMAFNGTRHFAKQEMVSYLEGIGMSFGPDINASTSFDETVYTLTVPTDDPQILETAFLILEDWAQGLSFDHEEIDRERGVVIEEWRLGRGAGARINDQQLPVLLHGSRYAERLPIGDRKVLESAPHEALRRFYRDWYRPDQMAVIAVGDFPLEGIEDLVRRHFAGLEGPPAPRPRRTYPVPDHAETLISIVTDPETPRTRVSLNYKVPRSPHSTVGDYRRSLVEGLYHAMLNDRLRELTREADPPYLFAASSSSFLGRTRDLQSQVAAVRDGQIERGLRALLTEVERADRYGFTATELERTKTEALRFLESAYKERDKTASGSFAGEYMRLFLEGEPSPGIAWELEAQKGLLPSISVEEVNGRARELVPEGNLVILVSAPESAADTLPGEERLLALFEEVRSSDIEPYVDEVPERPLLEGTPAAGEVVAESEIPEIGVTCWRLSNGTEVLLKPTDFQNDEVLLSAFSPGGHSLVDDDTFLSGAFAASAVGAGGLGSFDAIELSKVLAGTVAQAAPYIGELEEGLGGSASPQDLESLFQQVYLIFTHPRKDETAFRSLITRLGDSIKNRSARPETEFSDRLTEALFQDHPRRRPLTLESLAQIDLDSAWQIYEDRFADAGDFTFLLVGSFDLGSIRPLVTTYLASLPSQGRHETWRNVGVETPEDVVKVVVKRGLEPKSQVTLIFSGPAAASRFATHEMATLTAALGIRLREVLREDLGGTYGVSVSGGVSQRPKERYRLSIGFGCAPENVEALLTALFAEIERVKQEGVGETYLARVREQQTREREIFLRENSFWISVLESYLTEGWELPQILEFAALQDETNEETLRQAARRYLRTDRYVLGVLYPEGWNEESR